MKVAIIYWGLTRGLKHGFKNLDENLFSVLRENNIEYDNFIHTWYFKGKYKNTRRKIKNVTLDFEEYKLLNTRVCLVEDQDKVIENFNFEKYRTKGDIFKNKFQSHTFRILAFISQQRIIKEFEKFKGEYDYVIFQRPDTIFYKKLDINFFNLAKNSIVIPSFGTDENLLFYNDRWAVSNIENAIKYGNAFDLLLDYCKNEIFHPEMFLGWLLKKHYKLNISLVDNRHAIIGPDGKIIDKGDY